MDVQALGRVLVVVGLVVALIGGILVVGGRLGLGQLPGDLSFRRGPVRIYLPIATSIVVSIVLTVLLNLFLRR